MRLDLSIQNFENQCHSVQELLKKNGLFLRVYKLKEKFRYLIKQNSEKKTVLRELSSCVIEKFNDFNIARTEFSKKLREQFRPINIIYKSVKKCNFFSKKLNLAFRVLYSEGQRITGHPGYVYNFNTQSLLTFEENLKYNSDIPLVAYINFETTAPTAQRWIDPKNRKMFAVSYVIIFEFSPDLHIDRVIIERSFGHSLERLADLSYLTRKQLKFKDKKTLLQ